MGVVLGPRFDDDAMNGVRGGGWSLVSEIVEDRDPPSR